MITPIIKATYGKNVKSFYTLTEYHNWMEKYNKKCSIKYYKGLGTSTSKEAKLYQRRLVLKMAKILWRQRLQREFHSKTTLLVWTCSMLLRSRIPTLHGKES